MRTSREDELVYRRGLVMGLTMAEVMVLVLFALLLLIGSQSRRISQGEKDRSQLVAVAKAIGVDPQEIPENFDLLVASAAIAKELTKQAADNEQRQNALRDTKELIELGRNVREKFGQNSVGQSKTEAARNFVASAGDAFSRNGKKFGSSQIWVSDAVNAQAKDSGNGRVLPPCVEGMDGKPAYLFTARLFDQQIELEDRDLVAVRKTDAGVLLEQIIRGEFLSPAEFLRQTSAVFEWSKVRNCRFFVWIDDATGATEKRLYKERLRAVGQHFYYFEPSESIEGRRAAQRS